MVDRLEFLQDQLELNSTKAKHEFVGKAPTILTFTKDLLEEKIMRYQLSSLGLTKREVAKVIRKQPTLLGSSIENNLEPSLKWLIDRFGQSAAEKMVTALPAILAYSVRNKLESQMQYFQERFPLDDDELVSLVSERPQLFTVAQSTMEEKIQFFIEFVGGGEADAMEQILQCLVALTYSLKKRLRSRWEEVLELELPQHGFTVPMSSLASYPPARWEKYLDRRRKLIVERKAEHQSF
ncbi:mTERF [Seminavis robusta]|uniref:mTERF n=1 Tax=Seminavis robusta TaxID=568900 RepID=A0A9N8DQI5_9STRA|nr:mTERF [Seminavis robusta]|eukprot:Sro280_g106980.1 mTERF (238) ;mRNA; r:11798-12511